MYTLTFIFHIASLAVFVAGLWYISGLRSRNAFSRKLWKTLSGNGSVFVDSPEKFLKRFCDSLGIELEGEDSLPKGNHCRIEPKALLDFYVKFGISLLRYRCVAKGASGVLSIVPCRAVSDTDNWRESIAASLSSQLEIEISSVV